jgi:hypothetical protein
MSLPSGMQIQYFRDLRGEVVEEILREELIVERCG